MARHEDSGPDFDDRLIKLVRANPAIYDVMHPHYRRTPVRMAIWDNIARELGAPSRFLQTKWKNIRYNYLQEQKCLETGTFNTNIRKRRFTEDLSFLKYTAYRRDSLNSNVADYKLGTTDNDPKSYMYPDNYNTAVSSSYEVIELDQSDDEDGNNDYMPDVSAFLAPMNDITDPEDPYARPDNLDETKNDIRNSPTTTTTSNNEDFKITITPDIPPNESSSSPRDTKTGGRGNNSPDSQRSSPLLTPMNDGSSSNENSNGNNTTNNNDGKHGISKFTNGGVATPTLSEVTIKPLASSSSSSSGANTSLKKRPSSTRPEEIMQHYAKRKAAPTLQPINDAIELYCLSLVDCLRAMSRSERERVKFEFSKILKDAQYMDQS
ncbi:dorsal interacting protein 3 isoform X2 [Musca autumnalis]|uniref:dorsal interacting protein 3 isoform X2 n=1 Tax=Musca autumnalis TaxID=221902 RepID=UPI003CEE9DFF